TFMYQAVARGDVDVISAFTSDGRIAQYHLTVLSDPKQALPPFDAIVLIAPRRANDAKLVEALAPLIGAIDVDMMRAANMRVDNGRAPAAMADALWSAIQNRK